MSDDKQAAPKYTKEWVWVYTHTVEGTDQILVLADPTTNDSFMPTFATKEHGLINQSRLPSMPSVKLELQAMAVDDVIELGTQAGYRVVLIDQEGQTQEVLTQVN